MKIKINDNKKKQITKININNINDDIFNVYNIDKKKLSRIKYKCKNQEININVNIIL
jgi:hypothetical protein